MGKGSYDSIELSSIQWELLREFELRHERIDKLNTLGFEISKVNGEWFYRQAGSNNKWTAMDKK